MRYKSFSRRAFTMIELIFVIVIIGIISKFGVEFLSEAYKSFIYSNVNNTLQSQSATAVEFVASRLQHRIKDSIIVRNSNGAGFVSLSNADNTHNVLEWVGADIDGFRGLSNNSLTDNLPNYSGIMDLDHPLADANHLVSPQSDTTKINTLIDILSYENSDINDSALYFIDSDSDINGYGWAGAITDQNRSMHPIQSDNNVSIFAPSVGSFSGIDVREYYKLAWSAYAVVYEDNNLTLYYDYQPWIGEKYSDGGKNIKKALIMQNVSTFRFMAIGSLVKIQICVKSDILEEDYSICKEKTIY